VKCLLLGRVLCYISLFPSPFFFFSDLPPAPLTPRMRHLSLTLSQNSGDRDEWRCYPLAQRRPLSILLNRAPRRPHFPFSFHCQCRLKINCFTHSPEMAPPMFPPRYPWLAGHVCLCVGGTSSRVHCLAPRSRYVFPLIK